MDVERDVTLLEATRAALVDAMDDSERVVLLGQDVGRLGGVFRATEGLLERFPGRVFDTPLAEGGIVGASVGLAIGGLVPVAEIQFAGFLHQAFHQVTQQLARYRFRSRGRFHLPVTIRAPYGGGLRMPEFHPDSLEAQLANVPGLKVFAPAFPDDAYALLSEAVRDPDPVLFLEPQRLYRSVRGPLHLHDHAASGARLRREGDDVLLVSWGPAVHTCLAAAEELETEHGVQAAVLDLRRLSPIDDEVCARRPRRGGESSSCTRAYGRQVSGPRWWPVSRSRWPTRSRCRSCASRRPTRPTRPGVSKTTSCPRPTRSWQPP